MNRSTLEVLVRTHYLGSSIPPDLVSAWIRAERESLAVLRAQPRTAQGPRSARARSWLLAAAGSILAAVVAWFAWVVWSPLSSPLARAVAAEVAAGHAKSHPLDVEAASFAELRQRMDRLGFTLVEPGPELGLDLALLGARYCTLQGRPAALIRLQDARGEGFTLYQTQDHPSLSGLAAGQLAADGSLVRIWRKDGLLLVLASAAL